MNEPKTPKAGGLWGRLFGVQETEETGAKSEAKEAPQPAHAEPVLVPAPAAEAAWSQPIPEAVPGSNGASAPAQTQPVPLEAPSLFADAAPSPSPAAPEAPAQELHGNGPEVPAEVPPVSSEPAVLEVETLSGPTEASDDGAENGSAGIVEAAPVAPIAPPDLFEAPKVGEAEPAVAPLAPPLPAEPPQAEAPPVLTKCLACGAPRKGDMTYCDDCGWMYPAAGDLAAALPLESTPSLRDSDMSATSSMPLKNRFELGGLIVEREGVRRHRGIDLNTGQTVVIVVSPVAELALPVAEIAPVATVAEDDIMPGFDEEIPVAAAVVGSGFSWPSIEWEKSLLEKAKHPVLPKILDQFADTANEYLILEVPVGTSLWDSWDDPEADAGIRYAWLMEIAAGMEALHKAGAIYEGIRPDVLVIGEDGKPRIIDLTDLLPLPLPPRPSVRGTLYTAPELILSPSSADGRSDLYSFGAMLYSLEYLHHPLEKKDFEKEYSPLQITERFPDVHPMFLRLVNKTFTRDVHMRFPTDEMTKSDPSGFNELIKTLDICRRSFDNVRLDVSAWTTTGMIRTGNEDAMTVLHGVDARLDDLNEYAMVLLCDGMGGYDAGEVAADLAINEMRKYLLQQPIFAALTGKPGPKDPVDPKKYQDVMKDALRHANREVYTAARTPGKGKRGMGCTAECVYVDSHYVIAGHVGDSRVYHLHRGRLIQLTRDQTLVNRLVELGQLTAEEAEDHPRKNELQQAIGGQPDVVPGTCHGKLQRGDWVLVCSDGLTNHISNAELEKMLTREAANSAEEAARRLLNLVNLRGATDNATVVVIRAS